MGGPSQLWDGVLRRLAECVPEFTVEAWLRPLAPDPEGTGLRLLCPTAFHRDRVRERFLARIERCASEEAGAEVAVDLAVGAPAAGWPSPEEHPRTPSSVRAAGGSAPAAGPPPAPRPAQAELPYRFDDFVVGSCNALAQAAALAVARDSQRGMDLVYLCSDTGLGKTHLGRAVVAEARRAGAASAVYASAESFTSQFTAALRSREMHRFKRRFRERCDLLVLEDVQLLRGRAATQLELFHTRAHLREAGARVVLSGDRLPRETEVEPRLRSEMARGLVAEIEPPDLVVRRTILRQKASRGGVRLPEDCLELLADRVRGNVRDLEAVLVQLVSSAALLGRPIDRDLALQAVRKVAPEEAVRRRLDPDAVVRVVAAFFGKRPEHLAARSRRRDLLVPRQLAMYLCCRYTDAPVGEIAHRFARAHPAVRNAVRVIERSLLERAPLRYQVEALCEKLEALSATS